MRTTLRLLGLAGLLWGVAVAHAQWIAPVAGQCVAPQNAPPPTGRVEVAYSTANGTADGELECAQLVVVFDAPVPAAVTSSSASPSPSASASAITTTATSGVVASSVPAPAVSSPTSVQASARSLVIPAPTPPTSGR